MGDAMVPRPTEGRTFTMGRRARLGDVSPGGRLRLDAAARYLQDVASDDSSDTALPDGDSWIVRRTVVDVREPATFREWLELTTWCSGTGSRWAARRVSIVGERGAAIEAETLWVFVDPATGRPRRLPEGFDRYYARAAAGRTVSPRLTLPGVPVTASSRTPWATRFVDYDLLGHVNNAAYWAPVEEQLARRKDLRAPFTATIEYGAGIEREHAVEVVTVDEDDALAVWLVTAGVVAAAVRVERSAT